MGSGIKTTMVAFVATVLVSVTVYGSSASRETVQSWIQGYVGFEKNYGQVSDFEGNPVDDVLFRAKLPGYSIFITNQGVHYVLYQMEFSDASSRSEELSTAPLDEKLQESKLHYARIDLNLLGARIDPEKIEYEDPLSGYSNYYLPSYPDGILGVKTYRKVRIRDVYPGLDWVWRIEGGKVHHEFFVKAGANVSRIKLSVKWADVKLEDGGKKVVLRTPLGDVEDGEVTVRGAEGVEAAYKLEDGVLSYELRGWDGGSDIVVDPPLSLQWATFYGGNGWEEGHSITTDASGNVFVTGYTSSTDFPTYNPGGGAYFGDTLNGGWDAFILKFDNNGVRLWATYYGGSSDDVGNSITTDAYGNVFVTGVTYSFDFPTYDPGGGAYFDGTNNGSYDVFILKFDNNGVRLWATYYGGFGWDKGLSITTDTSGNVFVTGWTEADNFPTYDPGGGAYFDDTFNGYYDVFILKFNNNGERLWATYYGGSDEDRGLSITTDASGNVFVTGYTESTDFPTQDPGGGAYFDGSHNGYYDVFILKFDNNGLRLWATYYGGSDWDEGLSITTDAYGNVFVTGVTSSTDFPTYDPGGGTYFDGSHNGYFDVFILKFDNNGVRLWATFYGGGEYEWGYSITTDASGNVFVTGWTESTDFPTHNPGGGAYFDGSHNGSDDVFILKFNNNGVRLWATFYGGSSSDHGRSITTDAYGNVFVTGYTYSTDFPTYDPGGGAYFDGAYNHGDAFILKFEGPVSVSEDNGSITHSFQVPIFFQKEISLQFPSESQEPLRLALYNASGRTILVKTYPSTPLHLVLRDRVISKLPSGVYFLSAEIGKTTLGSVKLIKR